MTKTLCRVALMSLSLAVVAGCDSMPWSSKSTARPAGENSVKTNPGSPVTPSDASGKSMAPVMHKMAVAKISPGKAATTQPSNNHVTGKVTFTDVGGKVFVVAELYNLAPNSKHGIHIHERADLSSPDLSTAGPHFDPGSTMKHGDPMSKEGMANKIHAGDLGNLTADDKGTARLEVTVTDLSIDGDKTGIIGRSVIIHAAPDDLATQPSGNSGGRIAGGAIEASPDSVR